MATPDSSTIKTNYDPMATPDSPTIKTNYDPMATPNSSTIKTDHNNIIEIMLKLEWSDCCLTPNEQFFSHITARTNYIQ
jgi:hypothetical protein